MTAWDVLVSELWREYRELRYREFRASLDALVGIKRHTPNPRIKVLYDWLRANPPPGFPYRCKYCLHGTRSEDRQCAACWAY